MVPARLRRRRPTVRRPAVAGLSPLPPPGLFSEALCAFRALRACPGDLRGPLRSRPGLPPPLLEATPREPAPHTPSRFSLFALAPETFGVFPSQSARLIRVLRPFVSSGLSGARPRHCCWPRHESQRPAFRACPGDLRDLPLFASSLLNQSGSHGSSAGSTEASVTAFPGSSTRSNRRGPSGVYGGNLSGNTPVHSRMRSGP